MPHILIRKICDAVENNDIKQLSLLKTTNSDFIVMPSSAIVVAAYSGYLDILDWTLDHFSNDCLYVKDAFDMAAFNGKIEVLQWFKSKFCYKIKDITNAIILSCKNEKLNSLEWLKDNFPSEFKNMSLCMSFAISYSSRHGKICSLEWIYNNVSSDFQYLHDDMDIASEHQKINVLMWFKKKFPQKFNEWIKEYDFT